MNIFKNQTKVLHTKFDALYFKFLKGCQICQLHKVGPKPQRQFENRVNLNYTSMSKLSCDIKYMYGASTCHKLITVVADEVKNYLLTIPLYRGTSHKIGEHL